MMIARWRPWVSRLWVLTAALLLTVSTAEANVRLPAVIGNNMVLQKDIPLPIWGWADAGEEVTVSMGDSKVTAKADGAGKWKVTLPAIATAGGPHEMTVKGKNEIKIGNILIGEVWAGSGQSNMQWSVQQSMNSAEEIANATVENDPWQPQPLRNSPARLGQPR